MTKKSFYYNAWLLAFVITIAMYINMISQVKFKFGIAFQLEKANSDEMFKYVMRNYNLTDNWMQTYIYNNYLFILAFTILFYLSIKVIIYSDKVKKRSFLGIFSVIPGFFDALQNLLALEIVNHSGLGIHFSAYIITVWIKWIVFIPFVVLVFIAMRIQILRLFVKTTAINKEEDIKP